MSREALKEYARFYTEMTKLGVAVSLAVGGGAVGLVFNLKDELRLLAFVGAVFVELASVMFTIHSYISAHEYIKKLADGGY